MGEGSAGCCPAARGKPISQIIGSDPTVVPRYPAFIRLPDWGPGAGRRRRGSNYGCSCPVARGWRRGGRAGRGRQSGIVCAAAGLAAGSGRGVGGAPPSVPQEAPAPRPALCPAWAPPPAGSAAPLFIVEPALPLPAPSLAFALSPSLPLPSPLLPKERRASLWRRMSHE